LQADREPDKNMPFWSIVETGETSKKIMTDGWPWRYFYAKQTWP
jgi:hypothetical protein